MAARHWIASCCAVAALVLGSMVFAEDAPLPAPRLPERMPADSQAVPDAGAEQQPAPDATSAGAPATDPAIAALPAIPSEPSDGPSPALEPTALSPTPTPSPAPTTASAAAAALAVELQPVHLTARITDDGAVIPEGLVWRVFDTKTDASGELALAAKSEDAAADIKLPPGQYVVHVAYGRAQASEPLTVQPGENSKSIVLDAGALRLNAAITGDIQIPINLLRFDIYNASSENEHTLVDADVAANDIVTLNAGTYHVVSHFGQVNAVVRADLQVEPGKMTDATLYHKAAQVSFKLVTETGGEAIADVEWTIKSADGTTIFTDIGAFPATVLGEGDYLVLAKRGDNVYNRDFQVQAGAAREVEVLTTIY